MTMPYNDPFGIGFGGPLGGPVPAQPTITGLPLVGQPKDLGSFAGFVPQAPVGPAMPQGMIRDSTSGLMLPATIAPPQPQVAAKPSPQSATGVKTYELPKSATGVGGPSRKGIDAAQKDVLASYGKLADAERGIAAGEREELEATAEGQGRMAQEATGTALQLEHIQAQKAAYSNAKNAELDQDLRDIKDAQEDPDHAWNSMASSGKFATSAAMILGSLGSAIGGGPNVAREDWNRRVDRDIEAQRNALKNKKYAYEQKQNQYAANLAKYGDDERATLAMRAQYAAATQAQVARLATLSGAKSVQAKADMAIGMLGQEQDKVRLGFEQANYTAAAAQAAAAQRAAKVPDELKLDHERYIEATDSTGKTVTGYAPDKASAQGIRERLTKSSEITSDLDRIITITERSGASVKNPLSQESKQVQSILAGLKGKLNVDVGQGAISHDDDSRVTTWTGDPTSWSPTKGGLDTIKRLRTAYAQSAERTLSGANIHLVKRSNVSQNGIVTPIAEPTGQFYRATTSPTTSAAQEGWEQVKAK